ncbi:hypothetical protein ACP70R_003633 [Stipagrostis hirtigluma subsp. patula]
MEDVAAMLTPGMDSASPLHSSTRPPPSPLEGTPTGTLAAARREPWDLAGARGAGAMEEVAAALIHGADPAGTDLDLVMCVMTQHVYSCLPEPPVAAAAPLSGAAVAWVADGVDRISGLPPVVLRNVLSRLPAKDAARTTVLSQRWRRAWHSVPLVLVDAHLRPSAGTSGLSADPRDLFADPCDLTAPVSRALTAHPGPFRCVYLTGTTMDAHREEIEHWVQLLAAKDIKELVLVNCATTIDSNLPHLPGTLFSCTHLTRLYIGFWRFPGTATLPREAEFPVLRELGLCSLVMDDPDLAFLLNRCPILEKLIIVGSLSSVHMRIRSSSLLCVELCASMVPEIALVQAPLLERLLLWEALGTSGLTCSRIKIGLAPKLRFLGFLVPGMHELEIGNTIIKVGTKAGPSTTVPSVQMLALKVKLGARHEARMLPCFLRCFPNVETLYVQSENDDDQPWGPQSGSSSSGKLICKFWKDVGPIECVEQHIKEVVFREFRGKTSELNFLSLIAKHAKVLERMVVVSTPGAADVVFSKLRTHMASATWAAEDCKLFVSRSPFEYEGTPWCYRRAFDLSIKDPFDVSKCLEGKCLCA